MAQREPFFRKLPLQSIVKNNFAINDILILDKIQTKYIAGIMCGLDKFDQSVVKLIFLRRYMKSSD